MSTTTYKIIIVLPGTTGSTLVGGKLGYQPLEPVWPDQVMLKAITGGSGNPSVAAGLLEGVLYPGIVSGWFDPSKGYGSLAASLVGALSQSGPATLVAAQAPFSTITQNTINQWGLPNTLESSLVIGFAYDWRVDNSTSAALLQNLLFNINNLYGSAIDNITLIGHSMGGIVSRTYLEQLAQPNNSTTDPLFNKINTLITLGTPHLGAPLAWDAIVGNLNISNYMSVPTLSATQLGEVETMVEDFLNYVSPPPFDSTYELLPPIETNLALSTPLQADVKFIGTPSNGNFSPFDAVAGNDSMPTGLVSAIQGLHDYSLDFLPANIFLTKLSNGYSNPRQGAAKYYCIYGVSSVYPTCTGVNYTGSTPMWQDVPTAHGGDQIVPIWSATFGYTGPEAAPFLADAPFNAKFVSPTVNPQPPAGSVNHLQLPGSPDAQEQILIWLGIELL